MQCLSGRDGVDDRDDIRRMAASNRVDMIDEAILRPGRLGRLIEVPKPVVEGRERILEIHTRDMNVASDVDFADLAESLEEYSGADIAALATEAGMFSIRDGRTEVRRQDFDDAYEKIEDAEEQPTIPGHTPYQY